MKFKKEFLRNLTTSYNARPFPDGTTVIVNEIVDNSRWSIQNDLVFKTVDGRYFRVYYSVGATEMQHERPFEYEGDEIECEEVEPVTRTVVKYISKEKKS